VGEKSGNLGDRPADKDKCLFGSGSRDQEDLSARPLGLLCASVYGLFLDAILLYTPSGPLSDL